MKLSASQAAKKVGKSVPTITRAIKSGKLTAEKREGGGYDIDPSELFRVWPAVSGGTGQNPNMLGRETPIETSALQAELDALREKIQVADLERERERTQLTETIEDLRTRLDAESTERRALTAQLTDQREKATEPPRRFFGLLKG